MSPQDIVILGFAISAGIMCAAALVDLLVRR